MTSTSRFTALILLAAIVAGCGTSNAPSRTAMAAKSNGLTAEAASKDAQAAKLIATYQAVKGVSATTIRKRVDLIDKIGETDSDRGTAFLAEELERVDAEPEAAADKLVPAVVSALAELDEDLTPVRSLKEGESVMDEVGTEAKRKKRRFNVWDIIRKHFKTKKKRNASGGGGSNPPAPPVPPVPPGPAGI